MKIGNFNGRIFVIATVFIALILVPSFLAAWAEDEGTLGTSIIWTTFAKLFNILRFPTHTLFWTFIARFGSAVFFFGLFINCFFYGFMIERIAHFLKRKIMRAKLKRFYSIILVSIFLTNCNSSKDGAEKTPILEAGREAPLGWVYLTIYHDSTFVFTLTGIRNDKNVFKGKVGIRSDSLFFSYSDSIPRAGKTAIFNKKTVAYIDGEYPERLNINLTKLKM